MPLKQKRILFIIKQRYAYGQITKAYGLYNSCDFVARKLRELNIESEVVEVLDNNSIDREVARFKPTDVFIEALWVVPEKFKILSKLHPTVEWHIRLHSKSPFIATEAIAFEWMTEYMKLREQGIKINLSANSEEFYKNLKHMFDDRWISYSPNLYYPKENLTPTIDIPYYRTNKNEFHIGIFGALRPLKNHLQQVLWAIQFGEVINRPIVVHINVSEHENQTGQNGSVMSVLKNIRNIFNNSNINARLVEHPWYQHVDFLNIISQMDLGMQVSYSETFNITAADFVHMNVPIVASDEIKFINPLCRIDLNSSDDAMKAMNIATKFARLGSNKLNKMGLNRSNDKAIEQWRKLVAGRKD
jgi:hypothetical protein